MHGVTMKFTYGCDQLPCFYTETWSIYCAVRSVQLQLHIATTLTISLNVLGS